MFNFYSKKSKKIVSSIIIILLVLAMIVPTIASFSLLNQILQKNF